MCMGFRAGTRPTTTLCYLLHGGGGSSIALRMGSRSVCPFFTCSGIKGASTQRPVSPSVGCMGVLLQALCTGNQGAGCVGGGVDKGCESMGDCGTASECLLQPGGVGANLVTAASNGLHPTPAVSGSCGEGMYLHVWWGGTGHAHAITPPLTRPQPHSLTCSLNH
jgi:hypothetical protein